MKLTTTKMTGLMFASAVSTLALLQPAMALDAQTFVDRIETVYKVMGYDLSFGPATLDGTTVQVDGVTVGIVGEKTEPTKLDVELTFTGVEDLGDGSYSAEELSIPDVDTPIHPEEGSDVTGNLTLTGIVAKDLWLPPEGETGAQYLLQTVGSVETGPLTVNRNGAKVISYDSLSYVSDFAFNDDETLKSVATDFAVNNIWADLSTVKEEDAEAGAVIDALNLTKIDGNITQHLDWTMADGRMNISDFLFDFADIGRLNFKFDLTGFTPAVLDKMYAMAAEADPNATADEAQAKQMMAGMEMAQALSIASASIRYDDGGLAPRLLDLFAKQQGVDRAQFVEAIKPVVPAMLAQSGVPQLNDLVVPPVNTFLDDPKSFEIALQPPTPTSFLTIAAAAANPAGLVQALGLKVTANQ